MAGPRHTAELFPTQTAGARGYALVAPEQGIDNAAGGLTYLIPESLANLAVGDRVLVPLGRANKAVAGYVVEMTDHCDLSAEVQSKLKPVKARDPQAISLPPQLVRLAQWIAGYYCCPLGMVFATMLPAAVKQGTGVVMQTLVALVDAADQAEGGPKPSALQKKVLAILRQAQSADQPWMEARALAEQAGAKSISPVKRLMDKGMLKTRRVERVVSDLDLRAQQAAEAQRTVTLNAAQQAALDHLTGELGQSFGVHLLHGVTGSGKTEVYLRLIESVLRHDRDPHHAAGTIVLVPEIALTPQTVARFLARFDTVAVLHSGLTAAQRHTQWRRIRRGQASIVVGARSAVFAPLPRLSLIIVDEEQEQSYKQDQLPRYHARDVAIRRAQLADVPVVLGSATPSLETYYNAGGAADGEATTRRGYYHLIRLPQRVPGMQLPRVEIVDMIAERRQRRGIHLLSQRLETALDQVLTGRVPGGKGQAMLLLNRRGYANYIACPDHRCGWMMQCEHCDATMVYHKDARLPAGGMVRCHHCTAEQLLVQHCPVCSKKVTVFGLGTQRVEEEIAHKFPHASCVRMDSDTMKHARDYQQTLDRFRRGQIDILLGTQMIAKGLDFAGVRLVGVISGDTSLHMPDFRAAERTFQLIAQVSGRAGRSEHPGKVVVQSFSPDDPTMVLAAQHDYEGFAARELKLRKEMGLPPITRMARIVVRDKDHLACAERAATLAHALAEHNEKLGGRVRLLGPMPCPIARVADFYRHQIELIASPPHAAAALQQLLTAMRSTGLVISDARTAVDVDPVVTL